MSPITQEIAPSAEGEPFHSQALINTQFPDQETEPRSIPAQRPAPDSEVTGAQPVEPQIDNEPSVRSRSISELAAHRADVITQQIGSLTVKLEDAKKHLTDPMEIADLLSDPGSQRAVTLTLRRTGPEQLGRLNRELKAAERTAGRRLGATSLRGAKQIGE